MYPSWLMVEYASTLLMLVLLSAMVAAKIAVKPPMKATTSMVSGVSTITGYERATR